MTKSNASDKTKKPKRLSPILFGIIAFVLILGAMIFNSVSECVMPLLFPSRWKLAFDKGVARARVNRGEGIQMMQDALAQCEKSDDSGSNKAKLFYDYGVWNFNADGLANRFAIAKKSYGKCVAFSDNRTRKAMAYGMMADCNYYAGAAGDGEKNAEAAWKCRQEGGDKDPASLYCTLQALGRAHIGAGHYDQAEATIKQALEIASKAHLYDGNGVIDSSRDLACAYALEGKRELGDKTFLEAVRQMDRASGTGNSGSEQAIAEYARTLQKSGDVQSAAKLASKLDNVSSLNNIGPFWQAQ